MLEPRFFPRADIDLPMFLAGANARVAGRIVNVSEGGVLVIAEIETLYAPEKLAGIG